MEHQQGKTGAALADACIKSLIKSKNSKDTLLQRYFHDEGAFPLSNASVSMAQV
jgi:hypothetical protein